MPAVVPKSATPQKDRDEITEAVRDTVTLRVSADSPRTRMGRSQTVLLVISLSLMSLTHLFTGMFRPTPTRVPPKAAGLSLKTLET